MTKIEREAAALQQMTIDSEEEKGFSYNSDEIGRATVHTRQDLILIVSHISSLNRQVNTIKILLGGLLVLNLIALFIK